MDAKLKRKWIRALRSGAYEQGQYDLISPEGKHCCLGVLAVVQGCGDVVVGKCSATLPRGFNAGLNLKQRQRLAGMNDGTDGHKKHSFKEIADHISRDL